MAEESVTASEERRPDPNEKLVKVFDSEQESEAMVVKGLLDSAGIDSDLKSGSLLQDAFPGLGGMIILVREEDAQRARNFIAEAKTAVIPEQTADLSITNQSIEDFDDDETKA